MPSREENVVREFMELFRDNFSSQIADTTFWHHSDVVKVFEGAAMMAALDQVELERQRGENA